MDFLPPQVRMRLIHEVRPCSNQEADIAFYKLVRLIYFPEIVYNRGSKGKEWIPIKSRLYFLPVWCDMLLRIP